MNAQATLKLNGKDYNIHRMNYKFERDIDVKGRPCSCYYGGSIVVEFESTDDMAVFRNMIDEDMPASSGEILVTTGEDGLILRRLAFSDAYIYAYGEQMNSTSGLPMITTIFISPIRLDVNKNLRLNRRWPEANGWEVMKPEEVKVAQKTVEHDYDEQVQVLNNFGEPIADYLYYIECDGRRLASGRTDEQGLTIRFGAAEFSRDCVIYWGEEALAKIKQN